MRLGLIRLRSQCAIPKVLSSLIFSRVWTIACAECDVAPVLKRVSGVAYLGLGAFTALSPG